MSLSRLCALIFPLSLVFSTGCGHRCYHDPYPLSRGAALLTDKHLVEVPVDLSVKDLVFTDGHGFDSEEKLSIIAKLKVKFNVDPNSEYLAATNSYLFVDDVEMRVEGNEKYSVMMLVEEAGPPKPEYDQFREVHTLLFHVYLVEKVTPEDYAIDQFHQTRDPILTLNPARHFLMSSVPGAKVARTYSVDPSKVVAKYHFFTQMRIGTTGAILARLNEPGQNLTEQGLKLRLAP